MADNRVYTKAERNMVLMASCFAIFITPAMGTMVNLALVSIGSEFSVGTHELGWITTLFFLSSVVFLIPAARAANLYGKKKMFIIGLLITFIGNLTSAFSPDFNMLCVTRVITGAGAAFISCTAISMITTVFPANARGGALGLNTASVYLGASLGPVIGGFLTDLFGWRSIFYSIIPVVMMAFVLMYKVNLTEDTECGRFDYSGAVLYGISVSFTILGLINLPEVWAFASMFFGVVLLLLFYKVQKKVDEPLIKVDIFKNSRFSRSTIAILLNYASSYSVAFFLSLYLQSIGQLTATNASFILLAQPAVQTVLTPFMGKMSDKIDKRYLPTAGMLLTAVGLSILLFAGIEYNQALIIGALIVLGLGYGLFSAPNTNATMSYVKKTEYSDASALISTMRQVGMMLSLGISMCIISIIMGSADVISPETYDSFVKVMQVSWTIFICFSLVGAVISWFRGKSPTENPSE